MWASERRGKETVKVNTSCRKEKTRNTDLWSRLRSDGFWGGSSPGFWSCFMVSSRWVGSFIAEPSSVLPGDFPPATSHKPHLLCCYSWSISQLPFDCIWLHVEEYWCLWGQRCFLKGYVETLTQAAMETQKISFPFYNYLLHIFPSNDLQTPFLLEQKCKKR